MIFEFSYAWYEEYEPHLFDGSAKSDSEWQEECEQAMRDVGEDLIKSSEGWVGAPAWVEAACKKLEEKGYKRIEPVKYEVWGSYIVSEKEFAKIVGKELFNKAIKHNKKVQAELQEEDKNAE